jgi:hypothetical protein
MPLSNLLRGLTMIVSTKTVSGTYGGSKTPCEVFVATDRQGLNWYAVEDSQNVNATYQDIDDGVDVELLSDVDTFTWPDGIDSEETLETAVEA